MNEDKYLVVMLGEGGMGCLSSHETLGEAQEAIEIHKKTQGDVDGFAIIKAEEVHPT